jgi:hypothetical protein
MRNKEDPPKLPEGYRLDLASDPDAPVLRRSDGTVAARFSARGMSKEAIEREALEDMLHRIGSKSREVGALGEDLHPPNFAEFLFHALRE